MITSCLVGGDPTNPVIGAGLGSVAGSKAEKYITGGRYRQQLKKVRLR